MQSTQQRKPRIGCTQTETLIQSCSLADSFALTDVSENTDAIDFVETPAPLHKTRLLHCSMPRLRACHSTASSKPFSTSNNNLIQVGHPYPGQVSTIATAEFFNRTCDVWLVPIENSCTCSGGEIIVFLQLHPNTEEPLQSFISMSPKTRSTRLKSVSHQGSSSLHSTALPNECLAILFCACDV